MSKTLTFLFLLFIYSSFSYSQWVPDSSLNNPIAQTWESEVNVQTISDGAGGVIIVWRKGTIYAQRINSAGVLQWTVNGVPVSVVALASQSEPVLIADGSGGAIIAWLGSLNSQSGVFAQRINSSGTRQWGDNDVTISSNFDIHTNLKIVSDGSGGAIVGWNEYVGSVHQDIFAQKINSAGIVQWTSGGVLIRSLPSSNGQLDAIAGSDDGGAFFSWTDTRRFGSGVNMDIYLQKVNSAGAIQFAVNGITVCYGTYDARNSRMVTDGAGGVFVSWADARNTIFVVTYTIFAQRMSSTGVPYWTVNGINLCTNNNTDTFNNLTYAGDGTALVTWSQRQNNQDLDVMAQRIDANGNLLWGASADTITTNTRDQLYPKIISDGTGGAIVIWINSNNNMFAEMSVSAQRLNSLGEKLWNADGVYLSGPTLTMGADMYHYMGYPVISAVTSGFVVSWEDIRDYGPNYYDIYSQYLNTSGSLPVELSAFTATPAGSSVKLKWSTSSEINNFGFEVQRCSKDSKDFIKIAFIQGNGNSTVKNNYSYIDNKLNDGKYIYRLKQIDNDGSIKYSGEVEADVINTPLQFTLMQNYPNPFNPSTKIAYQVNEAANVKLSVYNILGQQIITLVNKMHNPGNYEVVFDGKGLNSGTYLYTLSSEGKSVTKKFTLTK